MRRNIIENNIWFSDLADIKFEWSSEDKGNRIKIEGPARLSYVGLVEMYNLIRTTKPIPQKNGTSFYFEAKIVNGGSNNVIAIGLTEADPNTRTNCMPGWKTDNTRKHTYSTLGIGYHGDDGKLFYLNGGFIGFFKTFTTGDVVGCLVHQNRIDANLYQEQYQEETTVEFIKNGQKDAAVRLKDAVWYPTIAMASIGAVVETNFGEHPFLYSDMSKNVHFMLRTLFFLCVF